MTSGGARTCVRIRREATILHADLDAFFASVEQRDHPALRGKPVIVGGGVVMAASYEARACGVRSAMGGRRARRLCPDAIVVHPRFDAYVEASRAVFAVFEDTTPHVEPVSIDEAFLDVRGLQRIAGTGPQIAARLRARVREECGLPISVGVATTKSLAKVASNAAKPDGLKVVAPGEEEAFLHPLPVQALWGVGPATTARLQDRGLHTVGRLAAVGEDALVAMFGRGAGRKLHAMAHNVDARPVKRRRGRRSIGSQSARNLTGASAAERDAALVGLCDRVTTRMRAKQLRARTVTLRLRFGDFTRATRSHTLPRPTAAHPAVLTALRELFAAASPEIDERGLTLVGLTLSNLDRDHGQLELPFADARAAAVDGLLDDVRERFGTDAATRAVLLGRRDDQTWLLPEDVFTDGAG